MYTIFTKEDTASCAAMEQFVVSHPNGHYLQSPMWAQVKPLWQWCGVLVYREEEIAGALSVLIRPLPLGFSVLYAPRGPVCDREDESVILELLTAAKAIAKELHALLLYIDPDEPAENTDFCAKMAHLGFSERSSCGFGNIQPQYVFRLSLKSESEDALFYAFSQKTRYNIRLAERKGVQVQRFSGAEEVPSAALDAFSELMQVTGARDHFIVRGREYFRCLLSSLGDSAQLFMAYLDGEPIAGTICIRYGKKAWYLYGASGNAHRGAMPNYLLQWSMIRYAMECGCTLYDFRGVPGDLDPSGPLYGLYRFKKGFSGVHTKFTGLFVYLFRPILGRGFLYGLQFARTLRHKLRT